jgi:hypothetical protein
MANKPTEWSQMRGFLTDIRLSRQLRKEVNRRVREEQAWRFLVALFETKRSYFRMILDELDSSGSYVEKRNRIVELCESGLYLSPIKEKRK